MPIRVLLCDDHAIIRDGLRNLLRHEPDVLVAGEATDGLQAVELARALLPDVVIMDLKMPGMNGVEAVEVLTRQFPQMKILVLTMFHEEEYLFQTIRAGAHGYLVKNAPFEEVIAAIRKVADGNLVLQSGNPGTSHVHEASSGTTAEGLSPREREVLSLLVDGLTNKEIANELCITETTVKLHTTNLYRKLGVRSRSQAIMVAVRDHIVNLDGLRRQKGVEN